MECLLIQVISRVDTVGDFLKLLRAGRCEKMMSEMAGAERKARKWAICDDDFGPSRVYRLILYLKDRIRTLSGRLAAAYIINDLTTGNDPSRTSDNLSLQHICVCRFHNIVICKLSVSLCLAGQTIKRLAKTNKGFTESSS